MPEPVNYGYTRKQRFEVLRTQLKNERESFIAHWRDLGDYIMPRRPRFFTTDVNKGDKRSSNIIDSTATLASRTLPAGMMGGITSPSRPWFRLATNDLNLTEIPAVKLWLDEVTRRMRAVLLKSNTYKKLPVCYKDMAGFATGALFVEEDFKKVLKMRSVPVGSYCIANDSDGRVNTFMREFRMTVRQIVHEFGGPGVMEKEIDWTNISDEVKEAWTKGNTEQWVDVVHIIAPNDIYDGDRLQAKYKKFISVYYEGSKASSVEEVYLRESGYDLFPVLVARWEVTGEDAWGTDCPGMTALGDIKQLQRMEKRALQGVEKSINPPLVAPHNLRTARVSLLPGDVSYHNEREGQKGLRPIHEVKVNLTDIEHKEQETRDRIRRVFYEDLWLMLAMTDRREMTAREVEEKHEEKFIILGSVLEQLNHDLLDPLIDLVFELMVRQGLIPDPPPELAGQDLKVEYISIMAQAQKRADLGAIERFMGFIADVVGNVDASALDKVDVDQIIEEYAERLGVPARVIRSDEAVQAIRDLKAKAQQAQQEMELMEQGAKAAKQLAGAKMDEDNALKRLADKSAQVA